ncbi:MAG TPA: SGNH/GDSL hydrolase family protein [Chloroflexota bacterium]|nr:SGNH/GDSL hydrolase family protein [Chloroflexota bacterium]
MRSRLIATTLGSAFLVSALMGSWGPPALSQSSEGAGDGITYAALGDSIAAGVGARAGYPQLYRASLEDQLGVSVQLIDFSRGGATSSDLVAALTTNQAVRDAVAHAQVISWNIGGNDLLAARAAYRAERCGGDDNQACLQTTVDRFEQNWDRSLDEIVALTSGHAAVAITMDIYDPYVRLDASAASAGAGSDLDVFVPYLDEVNQHIATTSAGRGVDVASVREAFNGPSGRDDPAAKRLIAADLLHPNETGQKMIADLLMDAGSSDVARLRAQVLR